MAGRKKIGQAALPGTQGTAQLHAVLWRAADKLRGSIDAAQYKDFVLGLVFLKYVSEAASAGDGAFRVPEDARWDRLAGQPSPGGTTPHSASPGGQPPQTPPRPRGASDRGAIASDAQAGSAGIGELLDGAMDAIMRANPPLAGVLPKIFSRDNVDQRRLAELVGLIGGARFTSQGQRSRDVLGEVYEYFLDMFARAEGKRGGEFYTPASLVKVLVEVLEPYSGRVYDPCCGTGGMFVQAEKFVLAHQGRRGDLAVYGQESNERTWRLATMNLAIHGIDADLSGRREDTFFADLHGDLKADFILANPPFNMSDWARETADPRWRYGVPPAGNANFAWLQHIVHKLAANGSAGVVMANGSMSSRQSGEGEIRAGLVEADLVACMVALPPQLFRTTQLPACLWFFCGDKGPQGAKRLADRRGDVLFIDARSMGTLVDRTERVLTDDDIATIAGTYHAWRGTASARAAGLTYSDVPGFCYSASLDEVRGHRHLLNPGRYVGAAASGNLDDEPGAAKIDRLTSELVACFDESARLALAVRSLLERLDA
jgi:type I restriction enzyme M protein